MDLASAAAARAHSDSDQRLVAKNALACAIWMGEAGIDVRKSVGSFGPQELPRGTRVRIRRGAFIRRPDHGVSGPAKRAQVVIVNHCLGGWVDWSIARPDASLNVHNPVVVWPGSGGYWQEVDLEDVEVIDPG